MDFSTIDLDKLTKRPTFRLPGGTDATTRIGKWSIQEEPGCGCFGDPPGYPSYFLRAVYVGGNNPQRGPQHVITYEGKHYVIDTADDDWDMHKRVVAALYKPTPMDSERFKLWERATYKHHHHCYRDDENKVVDVSDGNLLIYPLPNYKLKKFVDDTRFNDEWRRNAIQEVESYNADIQARAAALAVPENHSAVRIIKKYYPDYVPNLELIAKPDLVNVGDWWETEASRPSKEECRATRRHKTIGSQDHDETNEKDWCQWCGWYASIDVPGKEGYA